MTVFICGMSSHSLYAGVFSIPPSRAQSCDNIVLEVGHVCKGTVQVALLIIFHIVSKGGESLNGYRDVVLGKEGYANPDLVASYDAQSEVRHYSKVIGSPLIRGRNPGYSPPTHS